MPLLLQNGANLKLSIKNRVANPVPGCCYERGTVASPPDAETNVAIIEDYIIPELELTQKWLQKEKDRKYFCKNYHVGPKGLDKEIIQWIKNKAKYSVPNQSN